jgi:hypothetical protein
MDLDPRQYVDRETQQGLLRRMVSGEEEARVLLIAEASGQGKSDLLQKLRVNCREGETRAPVLLTDLRDLTTAFGFVERATQSSANVDFIDNVLTGFIDAYEQRTTVFVEVADPGPAVENNVAVHGDVGDRAVVAGQYFAVPAGQDSAQSHRAERKCLRAFLDDLRSWDQSPVVLLIDHFNKAGDDLRRWVDEQLIRPCLHGEFGHLVIVLASTPDEAPEYESPYVRRTGLDPLHTRREHVAQLMRAHRLLADDDDPLLNVVMDRLERGMDIITVINLCAPFALGAGHGT